MGTFTVQATVGNLDAAEQEQVEALVDTGSTFSALPASLLRRLGIAPTLTRRLRLANGQVEEYQAGTAFFTVNGRDGAAMVVFGPEDVYLLGATTLESLLFVVDPVNKRLIPEVGLLMWGGVNDIC